MNKAKILVVDDETTLCEILKLNLNLEGFDVDTANSAEEALSKNLTDYRLILLDVMMGEMSGYDFISCIRSGKDYADIPIILCTAKSNEQDRIEGLMKGADDYICKPFSMKELVLRVKSILRRTNPKFVVPTIDYDGISINPQNRTCIIDNIEVDLTRKEFDLLYLLLSHQGNVLSREEILSSVWDDDVYVVDRSVDVTINRVRKKLGKYSNHIVTKHGFGYGFK